MYHWTGLTVFKKSRTMAGSLYAFGVSFDFSYSSVTAYKLGSLPCTWLNVATVDLFSCLDCARLYVPYIFGTALFCVAPLNWFLVKFLSNVRTWSCIWSWIRMFGVLFRTRERNWFMFVCERDSNSQVGWLLGFGGNGRLWFQAGVGPLFKFARFFGSSVCVLRESWKVARCAGPWELWDRVPVKDATLGVHGGSLPVDIEVKSPFDNTKLELGRECLRK